MIRVLGYWIINKRMLYITSYFSFRGGKILHKNLVVSDSYRLKKHLLFSPVQCIGTALALLQYLCYQLAITTKRLPKSTLVFELMRNNR